MLITPESFRMQLTACLSRLAAAPETQAEYLRSLGVHPSADELGLELHEFALLLREKVRTNEISFAEKAAVQRLDRELENLSGPQHASLWTVDALASSDEWTRIRVMASECLRVFEGAR